MRLVDDGVDFIRRDRLADLAFQVGEDHFGLLDARAGRRPRVQPHLARIDRREEIPSDEHRQAQRSSWCGCGMTTANE